MTQEENKVICNCKHVTVLDAAAATTRFWT